MIKLLHKKIIKNQKGAMDRVLVTLLLVIVGVSATVGLNNWVNTEKESIQNSATSTISSVVNSTK